MLKTFAEAQFLWQNIPSHWSIKPFKHLCVQSALYGANITSDAYDDCGVRFLRTTDIREDGTLEDRGVYIAEELVKDYLLSAGDLIISRSGTIGRAFLYSSDYGSCAYAGYLVRFILNSRQSSRYYFYITKSSPYQLWLSTSSIESTIGNVNGEKYANFLVPNPPISEQKEIAHYLDQKTAKIDELIKVKKRLLELLDEKRSALITHAVTRGLNPDVPMRDSGVEWIGEIPKHWKVINLKFLGQVRTGVAKGRNLGTRETVYVPYLRVANVQDGYLDLSDISEIEVLPEEVSSFNLKKGDVLMNEGGDADKLGRGAIWDGSINPCLHQNHVFAVRCFSVEPIWLTTVTKANYSKAYLESRGKQSTNLASISVTNLRELPVILPPKQERQKIIKFLESAIYNLDQLFYMAKQTIQLLEERRIALITAAVTGQLQIKD